jgi:hypothetical protein
MQDELHVVMHMKAQLYHLTQNHDYKCETVTDWTTISSSTPNDLLNNLFRYVPMILIQPVYEK